MRLGGNIFVDVETCSTVDLPSEGADRYFSHPDTRVICLEAITDDGEWLSWSEGEDPPERLQQMAYLGWQFWAHNVRFEQLAFKHILVPLYGFEPPEWWGCTMARARYNALPSTLEHAAKALGLPVEKDMAGHRLMLTMCRPRGYDKMGGPVWWHRQDADKLQRLKAYCRQDCRVSMAVHKYTRALPEPLVAQWDMVQRMNERGIGVDLDFARAAVALARDAKADIDTRLKSLTRGLVTSANKVAAIKHFINIFDVPIESLDKRDVGAFLAGEALPEPVRDAINLRLDAAKSSVSKYQSMLMRANADARVRDSHVWHGAGTGRLSSQGLQTQNFRREIHPESNDAIDYIKTHAMPMVEMMYGEPLELLSQLLRPALIAQEGREFVGGDLSQIEGRITVKLARDERIMELFRNGEDVYHYTARFMFGLGKGSVSELHRQAGKVCDLALGFGGGQGALLSMARMYGLVLTEAQAKDLVIRWRTTHEAHMKMWEAFERAAMEAVRNPGPPPKPWRVDCGLDVDYASDGRHLYLRLPSGRLIVYREVRIENVQTPWGTLRATLTAAGVNSVTRKFERYILTRIILVENAVQAIAADVMFNGMREADASGYEPVLSVHDELVCEPPVQKFQECSVRLAWVMTQPINWLPDVPLAVKTWRGPRYAKK